MIYGGCFYHTVSGFVTLKPAGRSGIYSDDDDDDDDDSIYGGGTRIDTIGIKLE